MLNWLRNEEGQGMVEYGLIIGLIAIVVIGALLLLGPKVRELFTRSGEALDDATGPLPSAP
jgi:pilus assembly protein Flp/PilA